MIQIPLPVDVPLYSMRVTLDGREFIFEFDWHERELRWYLSIRDTAGEPILLGLKILANWPLLRRSHADPRVPPGHLFARDTTALGTPPLFGDLGRRVTLVYLTDGESLA